MYMKRYICQCLDPCLHIYFISISFHCVLLSVRVCVSSLVLPFALTAVKKSILAAFGVANGKSSLNRADSKDEFQGLASFCLVPANPIRVVLLLFGRAPFSPSSGATA
mmetsp:Transcript_74088/g.197539  ORF Transcript_74088/g.197539 Transcript_74088/m.197539 type:complete len:108 (+) Transcript_74088:244-567(+)